jgi:hypothetical protein
MSIKKELNINQIEKQLNQIGFKLSSIRINKYNNKKEYLFYDKINAQIILREDY